MTSWLAPVLGVIVVGVIIELVTKDGRMGKLIRAIYAFIVLYVIVAPLPNWLKKMDWEKLPTTELVNSQFVSHLQQSGRQNQIQQTLRQMGYPDALVSIQNETVYINLGCEVTDAEIEQIKQQIGTTGVYII